MNSSPWSFICSLFNSCRKLVVLNIKYFVDFFSSLNSISSESNYGSANVLFLKTSWLFVNSIRKFYRNLNSLNFLVIWNNLFLIEDVARLSWTLDFSEFLILILSLRKNFSKNMSGSNFSVRSAGFLLVAE